MKEKIYRWSQDREGHRRLTLCLLPSEMRSPSPPHPARLAEPVLPTAAFSKDLERVPLPFAKSRTIASEPLRLRLRQRSLKPTKWGPRSPLSRFIDWRLTI